MKRVITSTGGLIGRVNGRDYTLLRDALPRIEADGVEFMLYESWYGEIGRLTDCLTSIPVKYTGLHAEKSLGVRLTEGNFDEAERIFDINCQLAKNIGAEHIVIHLWDGVSSDSHMENNISGFASLQRMADSYGIPLSVENVVCNRQDPFTHLKELLRVYPDIQFTYDTKMTHFHRLEEKFYGKEGQDVWNHVTHLHVNDHRGAKGDFSSLRTLQLGDGEVDLERFFDHLRSVRFDGDLVCEAVAWDEQGGIHPEIMNRSMRFIRDRLNW